MSREGRKWQQSGGGVGRVEAWSFWNQAVGALVVDAGRILAWASISGHEGAW